MFAWVCCGPANKACLLICQEKNGFKEWQLTLKMKNGKQNFRKQWRIWNLMVYCQWFSKTRKVTSPCNMSSPLGSLIDPLWISPVAYWAKGEGACPLMERAQNLETLYYNNSCIHFIWGDSKNACLLTIGAQVPQLHMLWLCYPYPSLIFPSSRSSSWASLSSTSWTSSLKPTCWTRWFSTTSLAWEYIKVCG